MSVSRFRHTHPTVAKPDAQFLNVASSQALWTGSNMIACSDEFVAVPWQQQGSTAVFAHTGFGRIGSNPPVLVGHEGPVIDVQFDPFNKRRLLTASEDGNIMGWDIPEGGLTETCSTPAFRIQAHDKKCGTIAFHPSASGVLASCALDNTVKVWDIEKKVAKTVLSQFEEYPMDIAWNLDGSEMCVVTRDKKLSVVDARDGSVTTSAACHDAPRALRCVWAKRKDQIITFGWDGAMRRQMKVWDPRKLSRAVSITTVDQGSAAMMPMLDEDLSLLYVAYKGEGAIRAYELVEGSLVPSHEHLSSESVKGVCPLPKTCLNVKQCEIGRVYELGQQNLITIHMSLPRRQCESEFQRDVYPPTFASTPAITAEEYFTGGKNAAPCECDLEYLFSGAKPTVKKTTTSVKKENDVSGVKALKRPPKKEPTEAPAHADPTANMAVASAEKNNEGIAALLTQLTHQREEAAALRAQVKQKEDEMEATLSLIQTALEKK